MNWKLEEFTGAENEIQLFLSYEQQWQNESQFWSFGSIRDSLRSGARLFFTRDGSRLHSFCLVSVNGEDSELLFIYAPEPYRRSGVSGWLFNAVIKILKENGTASMYLEVRRSNHAAISFYTKNLFVQISVRNKYYNDGEDAVIMKRDF